MSNDSTMDERKAGTGLRDREEIRQIMYAYSRAADAPTQQERAQVLGAVLADDGAIEYTFGTWTGRGEVIAALGRMVAPFNFTHHIISSDDIRIDGDQAIATYVVTAAHSKGNAPVFWAGARYTQQLVRTSDGWRLRRHVCVPCWQDENARLPEKPGDVPES